MTRGAANGRRVRPERETSMPHDTVMVGAGARGPAIASLRQNLADVAANNAGRAGVDRAIAPPDIQFRAAVRAPVAATRRLV